MSNIDQTKAAAPATPPPPVWVPPELIEEFRQKYTDIMEKLSDLDGFKSALGSLSNRVNDVQDAREADAKALHAVTEKAESVTELSRRLEHALQQMEALSTRTQGAAEAHGSTNELGQNVMQAMAWIAGNLADLRASANRPWHGDPGIPAALAEHIKTLGFGQ